jgi:adenylate cyclase
MATQPRLAVILHADVVGSTALVQLDERIAHQRIQDAFRRLSETLASHGGTTHELRGDALVAELPRASDAVSAAVSFQSDHRARNDATTDAIRVKVRIGIALGEVIVADQTITGPGVVLAQRIEQLAEDQGVCISAAVYEAVPKRLPVTFTSLGDRSLKGFDELVRVYSVSPDTESRRQASAGSASPSEHAAESLPPAIGSSADRPSIAVLPFDNLSGDPEQEFFADGMAEDIITGLSRFRSLSVRARSSTFGYKGKSPDVREIARDLGVRYVLEGSVRRSGERVRITGQLIDASTGNQLWGERFDRGLDDIFAVQDEVTQAIVAAIAPEIGDVERDRAQRSPPESLDAWGLYQRGLADYYASTESGLKAAIDQFDKVNEIDPGFAPAFAMGAGARWRYGLHFHPDDQVEYFKQGLEKADTAIKLDPRDPTGHYHAGEVHSMLGDHEIAVLKVEEAIRLNPNDAIARYFLGGVLRRAGRYEEAIPHFDHAMRLSPRDIWITGMLTDRAFVLFALERYDEALEWARRARLSPNPRTMTLAVLAAVLSKLGRREEARSAVDDLVEHWPGITCARYRENLFGTPDVMARLVGALGEAGLPE